MKELLTTNELCEKLKVTRRTIINWRKEGMPFVTVGSRLVRFDEKEVNKWIKNKK